MGHKSSKSKSPHNNSTGDNDRTTVTSLRCKNGSEEDLLEGDLTIEGIIEDVTVANVLAHKMAVRSQTPQLLFSVHNPDEARRSPPHTMVVINRFSEHDFTVVASVRVSIFYEVLRTLQCSEGGEGGGENGSPQRFDDDDVADGTTCIVCMDAQANTLMQCGHAFCEKCVSAWFAVHRSCPMCRARGRASDGFVLLDASNVDDAYGYIIDRVTQPSNQK
eukprot:PhM_4_TR1477/c0_g1_i1/m.5047